ncbi:RpiB/LacA/LacB family sugar-phosphate isomerase [Candidatus Saccharibacteria bacterium]|nr:RpiB/LacA/LacB family sugar-phosphate isomerase [Candidatus Saccharibacteria bacterium]
MKIYLGADHGGFNLKGKIMAYLAKRGIDFEDVGNLELDDGDDFPRFAQAVALKVIGDDDEDARGILICKGGQGMAMSANRFRGVRAIVASTAEDARHGRNDNNANVLSLPARVLDNDDDHYWQDIVDTFLDTEFAGAERFVRRNDMIDELS